LKDAYGIIVSVSRDKGNNSRIIIHRERVDNNSKSQITNRVIQNYYSQFVQRQHTQNYNNLLVQNPLLREVTSGVSEPPVEGIASDGQSGGSEVPEVNSSNSSLGPDKTINQDCLKQAIDSNSESEIFESFKNDLLEKIRLANGSTVSVPSVIESLCKLSEPRRKYIGTNLSLRENEKLKSLHIAVIRSQNVEVIAKIPELYVKWIEPTSVNDGYQSQI
jgi:hypothetical protein